MKFKTTRKAIVNGSVNLVCAGLGLQCVFPGWVTSYYDYTRTVEAIKRACKEMRETVKSTPTWRQYEKGVA